jgi:peptidoglycan/LPS O-acetylase OafA/YrhL
MTAFSPGQPRRSEWRSDIQALRGLAVLLVVLDHANIPFLSGGFLGVDIFFVISGFLMTIIITEALDAGRFSFKEFYARRARRLLPAAYATITITAIAGYFLLDSFEFQQLFWQTVGAFGFFANHILWQQTDYFSSGADLKPLLHLWSLSIEEQFYLFLPLMLFVAGRRWRVPGVALLTIVSLAGCLWLLSRSPSAVFYFLPTRAWELGLGALTALLASKLPNTLPSSLIRMPAIFILVALPFLVDEKGHPGFATLAICIATALLLAIPGRRDLHSSLKPLVWFGNRSYTLYLVHWPIFAFANNMMLGTIPASIKLMLLGACLVAMEIQFRWIEQPFRQLKMTYRSVALLVLVPVAVLGVMALLLQRIPASETAWRTHNHGLSSQCLSPQLFQDRPECRTSSEPGMFVWGDSFAMHLMQGLAATSPEGIQQGTRVFCGPMIGLAPVGGAQFGRHWAERCLAFNRSIIAHLEQSPHILIVVLSSSFVQYLPEADPRSGSVLREQNGSTGLQGADPDILLEALSETARTLRRMGKRVVVIAPPPASSGDPARCISRLMAGVPTFPSVQACDFSYAEYLQHRHSLLRFLAYVEARDIAPVIRFDDYLCSSGRCITTLDRTPLYQDSTHLSIPGSRLLGQTLDLGQKVRRLAR